MSARYLIAVLLLVVSMPAGAGPGQAGPTPELRNVVLVSIDSLRADHVGCYGYERATTPTIDRLAEEGVRFAHATTPSSWTLPAHATLLTGTDQWRHQAIRTDSVVSPSVTFLGEMLQSRGYHTVGFYAGPFLDPRYGFGRGFEEYVSCYGIEEERRRPSLTRSHSIHTNPVLRERLDAWIARKPETPFFAFIHMWDVHFDYVPPPRYVKMFDPSYEGRLDGRRIAKEGFRLKLPERDLAHLLARYDGEIRYTDDTLGAMLHALDEAGLLEETLVIVTADHGEEFLEHGGKGHQRTLFQEVTGVPLVFWAKNGLPRGKVVESQVSLADVAPTILDLLGIAPEDAIDGSSLASLWTDEKPDRRVVGVLYRGEPLRIRSATIQTRSRKVLRGRGTDEWVSYDLERDPTETRPQPVEPDDPLRLELAREIDERLGRIDEKGTAEPIPEPLERQLRALGYLE